MKKMIIGTVMLCFLFAAFILRVFLVNYYARSPEIISFGIEEPVAIGENYFWKSSEDMSGYTVRVTGSRVISTVEFLQQMEMPPEDTEIVCENLLLVTVQVQNESNWAGETAGIDLFRFMLMGTDYSLTINSEAFSLANPDMPGMKFSLKQGNPFEINMPYAIYSSYVDVDHVKSDMPRLQICAYPEMRLIDIK